MSNSEAEPKNKKKLAVFSGMIAICLILIMIFYPSLKSFFISGNVVNQSNDSIKNLRTDPYVSKNGMDTVKNKIDMFDELEEEKKQKQSQEQAFKDGIKDTKDKSRQMDPKNMPKHSAVNDKGSKKVVAVEETKGKKRVKHEDEMIPASISKMGAFKNMENESDPNFQFAGFRIKSDPKKQKIVLTNKASSSPVITSGSIDNTGKTLSENDYVKLDKNINSTQILQGVMPTGVQISGVVLKKTKVYANSSLSIRVTKSVTAGNLKIAEGTVITAIVSLNGQRVTGRVENINIDGVLTPLSLRLYDTDGNEGLVVGGMKKDANSNVRNGVDNAIGVGSSTLGLGGMVAGSFLSSANRNVNKAEATVTEGYQVILKN